VLRGHLTLRTVLHVGLEVFYLESHLKEVVLGVDSLRRCLEDRLGLGTRSYSDVGCQRRFPQTEGPDPEVVDSDDPFNAQEGVEHFVEVDVPWDAFHENYQGVPHYREGCQEDKDGKQESTHWVDNLPAWLEVDDESSDEDADTLYEVTDDMDEGGPHVDVLLWWEGAWGPFEVCHDGGRRVRGGARCRSVAVAPVTVPVLVQREPHYNIDNDANARRDKHDVGLNLKVHVDAPLNGQVDQDPSDQPDGEDGSEGANHLRPVPPEQHQLGGLPLSHPQGEQGNHEAGKVREEVGGVRRYRKTLGQVATYHFSYHEEDTEDARCDELLPRFVVH